MTPLLGVWKACCFFVVFYSCLRPPRILGNNAKGLYRVHYPLVIMIKWPKKAKTTIKITEDRHGEQRQKISNSRSQLTFKAKSPTLLEHPKSGCSQKVHVICNLRGSPTFNRSAAGISGPELVTCAINDVFRKTHFQLILLSLNSQLSPK